MGAGGGVPGLPGPPDLEITDGLSGGEIGASLTSHPGENILDYASVVRHMSPYGITD